MDRKDRAVAQRRRIVVTGSRKGSKKAWFFIGFLMRLLKVEAIFIHPQKPVPNDFDALLITGGVDICPHSHQLLTKCEPDRDALELSLLATAIQNERPVFGICRGMQLINHFFGGTLHHEIKELDLDTPHPYTPLPLVNIHILPHTKLHEIVQVNKLQANALHHQAIDTLGKGFRISAYDDNKIIQAIEHIYLPIMGVQWHPEYLLYHPLHRKLLQSFLSALSHPKKK